MLSASILTIPAATFPTDVLVVFETVSTIVGLWVSSLMIRFLLLVVRRREIPAGMLWIAGGIFAANATRFFRLIPIWLGHFPQSFLPMLVAFVTLIWTPVAFFQYSRHLLLRQTTETPRDRRLFRLSQINAAIGTTLSAIGMWWRGNDLWLASCLVTLAFATFLIGARFVGLRRSGVRYRGKLLYLVFTTTGIAGIVGVMAARIALGVELRSSIVARAILEQSFLLFALGGFFIFTNVRSIDVYLKRVFRILLWGAIALAAWYVPLQISRLGPGITMHRPEAVVGVVCLVVLIGCMSMLDWFNRRLDGWIDRWVFEQPDYGQASAAFWIRLLDKDDEAEVFEMAEDTIRSTLELNTAVLAADEVPGFHPALSLVGTRTLSLAPDDPARSLLNRSADLLLPVFVHGVANRILAIGRNALRPPLLSTEVDFLCRCVDQLQTRLGTMAAERQRLEKQRIESILREQLAEAELKALRAQVNPHFLFNSLNTIAYLSTSHPEQAEQMTLRLASVFRYVLSHSDKQFTSIREEIEFLRSYLSIEESRFGKRLGFQFLIDSDVLDEMIPTLLLQPLVENSLKHGLAPKVDSGQLVVRAYRTDVGLAIDVADDGVGLYAVDRNNDDSTGFGVRSVEQRLKTIYGELASLRLEGLAGGGTVAQVRIPTVVLETRDESFGRR